MPETLPFPMAAHQPLPCMAVQHLFLRVDRVHVVVAATHIDGIAAPCQLAPCMPSSMHVSSARMLMKASYVY